MLLFEKTAKTGLIAAKRASTSIEIKQVLPFQMLEA